MTFDEKAFEDEVRQSLTRSRGAFEGTYAEAISQLAGLSRQELALIEPGAASLEQYDQLIGVVKAASRTNASQSALRRQIERLGQVAISITKEIPTLASLFA